MAKKTQAMRVTLWDIADVKPYEQNPRHNDQAVAAVVASIQEFGFRQPIVVDADGVIVCGHTRYKAALELDLKKVPVHVAKDLTPEQITAYRIADNRTASLSDWDIDLLELELGQLADAAPDLFATLELQLLLDSEKWESDIENKDPLAHGENLDGIMETIKVVVAADNKVAAQDTIESALSTAGIEFTW